MGKLLGSAEDVHQVDLARDCRQGTVHPLPEDRGDIGVVHGDGDDAEPCALAVRGDIERRLPRLRLGLEVLDTGVHAARRDADRDERAVVRAAVEWCGHVRDTPLIEEVGEGLLALESYTTSGHGDPFLVKCLTLAIDGSYLYLMSNRAQSAADAAALAAASQLPDEEAASDAALDFAVKNLDAIAATEGVDGVFIGPNDLAADLGYLEIPALKSESRCA